MDASNHSLKKVGLVLVQNEQIQKGKVSDISFHYLHTSVMLTLSSLFVKSPSMWVIRSILSKKVAMEEVVGTSLFPQSVSPPP